MAFPLRLSAFLSVLLCSIPAGISIASVLAPPVDNRVVYTGRVDRVHPDRPVIFWPGTKVGVRFEADGPFSVILDDEEGINRFYLVIDSDPKQTWKFRCRKGRGEYRLPFPLGPGIHTAELFKATEYFHGQTVFLGFRFNNQARIFEMPVRNRRILYFGDSITAGMGVLDPTGVRFAMPKYTDHYLSYAALAARALEADHIAICRSGIGFMESWWSVNMPELFLRVRPDDPSSRVNPADERPDLIVVNLGQNDSMLAFRKDRFLESFKGDKDAYIARKYADFIGLLLDTYPRTPVLCCLGSMSAVREGSPWPGYIQEAAALVRKERPAAVIDTLIFPLMGDLIHPIRSQHERMAVLLEAKVREMMSW
jgi:hypothetical protein